MVLGEERIQSSVLMTPIYNQTGRKCTTYEEKKQALLNQGFTLSEAIRMADQLLEVYG